VCSGSSRETPGRGRDVTRPALSLVLPAYNEDANIARAVRDAAAAAGSLVADYEVIVVDDGSRDGTAAVLESLAPELGTRLVVVRHPKNRGYGAALRSGFAATRGELVFYTDSDNQFDLAELRDFLPLMAECDAALGYRVDRKDPWTRRAASGFFNRLSSVVFGMSVRDLNCSFKLFRGDLLRSLRLESDDFFIDTEMVARMHRGGWRTVQRGVRHFPRTAGRSTVRASDAPRTLAAMARFWLRLRARPGSRVTA
jgi:glycosyltransferase involved in cell wall biosynthesis